jgi:hypothetical protein
VEPASPPTSQAKTLCLQPEVMVLLEALQMSQRRRPRRTAEMVVEELTPKEYQAPVALV